MIFSRSTVKRKRKKEIQGRLAELYYYKASYVSSLYLCFVLFPVLTGQEKHLEGEEQADTPQGNLRTRGKPLALYNI